jgi:DNA-binding NtrC family response regulator
VNPSEQILVVDDDSNIRYAFRELLEVDGFEVVEADDGEQALELTEKHPFVLMFLDVAIPKLDGLTVLEVLKQRGQTLPVIVITAFSTMETAVRAVRAGAYEYLTKPLDVHKIRLLVQRCLEERRLKAELARLRQKVSTTADRYELIGTSPAMLEVFKTIGAIAGTPKTTNILILGESGTGKELVARQIHLWGENPEAQFLALNVTVLPDTLLESELFGYEKGAFTGALQRKFGKFELAGEGTIFLDEIGDLSPQLQQKLLRVLQEREFVRLGGHETLSVKARFIAATHDDLEKKVAQGTFRDDLYFRLNVVTLRLPPLRERREDIPLLAHHFAPRIASGMNRSEPLLPPETLAYLSSYDWPGNVRELENVLARAIVMSRSDRLLPEDIAIPPPTDKGVIDPPIPHHNLKQARRILLEAFEKKFVMQRLAESRGSVTQAAARAGINRQSFQRLMQKYGIHSSQFK